MMLCDLPCATDFPLLLGEVAHLQVLRPLDLGLGRQANMSASLDGACFDLGEQAVVALLLLSLGYNSYYYYYYYFYFDYYCYYLYYFYYYCYYS
jgi:hypothetical protein